MNAFHHTEIAQLTHELKLSPLRHRLRQVLGIHRAIELIDPEREYPYSFVCFQITGYRSRRTEETLLSGQELIADLVQMMDDLTAANPLPLDAVRGRLYDAAALASRMRVSTKTISRWRRRGLAGCWFLFADGQPRLGFTRQAIETFVSRHRDFVRRGGAFQLMSEAEKACIITRAREIVAAEHCGLHAVTQRLAEETGRAVETIRYTLRRFDRDHVEEAIFDRSRRPEALDQNALIYEAYQAGERVAELAARFGKREGEIRRILTRVRAERLAAQPLEYVYNASFDAPDAEQQIRNAAPANDAAAAEEAEIPLAHAPADLPAYLQALYRTPLLTRDSERLLFRRMNFLLHQAELRRHAVAADPASMTAAQVSAVEDLLEQAAAVKNEIIQANLRLVVGIAKRHLRSHAAMSLFELVSDGNLALIKAVEKFDYDRGFRFSTYASWAIIRSFARTLPEEITQISRFQTGHEEMLADARDHRAAGAAAEEQSSAVIRATLNEGFTLLDERERCVVERHFGLGRDGSAMSLEQIGRELGLSKERVRQIEMRAFGKLRAGIGARAVELLAS